MINKKIKISCLLSAVMVGVMTTSLPALTANSSSSYQKVEKEWKLLDTKDGVSCYYKIDQMGSGNGVYLRFVNNSTSGVSIDWSVSFQKDDGAGGHFFIGAGKTISSLTEPGFAIRTTSTSEPVISFTVSK